MRRHVYFYTLLDGDFDVAAGMLRADPGLWLPPPAERDEDAWVVDLRPDGALAAGVSALPARVELAPATALADRVLLTVRWRAVTAERLFPVLEADLELQRLEGGSHLSLVGSYRPPLSVVGELGDRLLGHRVAEACVRRFVLDVADRVGQHSSGVAMPSGRSAETAGRSAGRRPRRAVDTPARAGAHRSAGQGPKGPL